MGNVTDDETADAPAGIMDTASGGNAEPGAARFLRRPRQAPRHCCLRRVEPRARPGTPASLACIANQWHGLLVFLCDGRVEMDSNFVENRIRPTTAKNALFEGIHAGWGGNDVVTRWS